MCKCNCDPCTSCGVRPNQVPVTSSESTMDAAAATYDLDTYGNATEVGGIVQSIGFGIEAGQPAPDDYWARSNAGGGLCSAYNLIEGQTAFNPGGGLSYSIFGIVDQSDDMNNDYYITFYRLGIVVKAGGHAGIGAAVRFAADPTSRKYKVTLTTSFQWHAISKATGMVVSTKLFERVLESFYDLPKPCIGYAGTLTPTSTTVTPATTGFPENVVSDVSVLENTSANLASNLIFP